jgi:uncharacterized DUF497 family protein
MSVKALPDIIEFEWDAGNEQKNWLAHGVAAEEAEEPFFAKEPLILDDIGHSTDTEQRYVLMGKSAAGRMLFIAYTLRKKKIRIISARDADRKEVLFYEEALKLTKV